MVSGVFTIPFPARRIRVAHSRARPPADCSPREFVAGPENALARAAATVAAEADQRFSPLLIYGPTGVGKTHLALGLSSIWMELHPTRSALITDGATFARDFAVALDTKGLPDFRRRISRAGLIVVDGVDQLPPTRGTHREFAWLLDHASHRDCVVLATARRLPLVIGQQSHSLASRLLSGLIVPLRQPALAARSALATRMAAARGVSLSPEQASLIAAAFPGSVGALGKIVARVLAAADSSAQRIDQAMIDSCRRQCYERPAPRIAAIIAAVGKRLGIKTADLTGPSRKQAISRARGLAMHLSRELTDKSMAAIARQFHRSDHTTVAHACRATRERLRSDPALRRATDELTRSLTGE
jgi:chromosomal replication initiator protein